MMQNCYLKKKNYEKKKIKIRMYNYRNNDD